LPFFLLRRTLAGRRGKEKKRKTPGRRNTRIPYLLRLLRKGGEKVLKREKGGKK